ncbi:MAG: hypothetical protein AB8I69_06675 [Anaerolineae bacterium]|jgi:hypothetical protein
MESKQSKILTITGIVLDTVFGIVAGGIAGIAGAIIALSAFNPKIWEDFSAFISVTRGIWKEFLQGSPAFVELICLAVLGQG